MTIQVTKIWVRSDVNVPFYTYEDAAQAHVQANYIDTGKFTQVSRTRSANDTVLTFVNHFVDEAAYIEFATDPVCTAQNALRQAYNSENGIYEDFENGSNSVVNI